jgi:DNA-binding CsgD family transcriptional regulator
MADSTTINGSPLGSAPAARECRSDVASNAIVGRDEELAAIGAFFDAGASLPAVLLLEGQAGIGKTTLWRYGIEQARARQLSVLAAAPSQAEAQLAYAGLGDLLDGALGALGQLPQPQRHALEVALLLTEPTEAPPELRAIGLAVLGLLRRAPAPGGAVLAIDDVQWLDPASAAVLAFILRRLGNERIRLLVARRLVDDDEGEVPLGLERALGGRLQRVRLGPLSLGALHRIFHSRLGLTLSRPALHRVIEASHGNPFFALEIGALLKEREAGLDPTAPVPIPDTMRGQVQRRIVALSPAGREALLAAAATARAEIAVVEQVSSSAGVEEAIAAGVVLPERGRLRFAHPLLAEAVYDNATPGRRHAIHRRLAGVIVDAEERALHLARATPGADAAVANALDQAMAQARSRGAPAAAARLAEEAARVTPGTDRDALVRRTVAAADAWISAGDRQRAAEMAAPLVQRLPAGVLRADALLAFARTVADRDEFLALLERSLADAAGDDVRRAEILANLCYARLHATNPSAAARTAQEAVQAATRTGQSGRLVAALSMAGRIDTLLGRAPGADQLRRALAIEGESHATDAYEGPGTFLGWWHLAGDELAEARRWLEEQYHRALGDGDEYNQLWLCWPLAQLECRAGAYVAARRYADRAGELAETVDSPYPASAAHFVRALVAAHVGDGDLARATAGAGLAAGRAINSALFEAHNRVALGVLAASEGANEEARRQLEPVYALRETAGIDPDHFYSFWPDLVEALVALGERERAAMVVAEREQHARERGAVGKQALVLRCRALLEADAGALDRARVSLDAALRLHEERPVPLEQARTLFILGQVQRRAKLKRAARETLAGAREVFERLPAPIWAERVREETARIGGRAAAGTELTSTEQRIAALVAAGKPNKDVSASLFVTPHTVERALTRIYLKLGVRSRAELAARWPIRSTKM